MTDGQGLPERAPQEDVDAAVRDVFRGVAEPQLSPFFDRRLAARLATERARTRSLRRWRQALQLYWLVAAAASAGILLQLPADALSSASSPVLVAIVAGGAFLPGVLLLAALRKDPVELVFETLDWLTD